MLLPHHQAPALPLDQSCLPEESASAARAHATRRSSSSSSSGDGGSHHGSPTFSNAMPEFMECVIDSVSICFCFRFRKGQVYNVDKSGALSRIFLPLPVSPWIGAFSEQTGSESFRFPPLTGS